jgi:hypothetical protein
VTPEYRLMDLCDAYRIPCDINLIRGTYRIKSKTFRDINKALAEAEFIVAAKKDPTLYLRPRP